VRPYENLPEEKETMPLTSDDLLANHTALVDRIDAHTARVAALYKGSIACQKGCDACCRFLSLFPVEALALSKAFERLAPKDRERVEAEIGNPSSPDEKCPLLISSICMLYPARPVICRTHGFPIYMEKDNEALVDFCPKNFTGQSSFPKQTLLSLDQLNATLTAVNAHFLSMLAPGTGLPDRIPVNRALTLCRDLGLDPD